MIEQSDILRHFEYSHLPLRLQSVSRLFRDLAWQLDAQLPNGAEKSTALRKLLEGKDAAVRSARDLPGDPDSPIYHVQQ